MSKRSQKHNSTWDLIPYVWNSKAGKTNPWYNVRSQDSGYLCIKTMCEGSFWSVGKAVFIDKDRSALKIHRAKQLSFVCMCIYIYVCVIVQWKVYIKSMHRTLFILQDLQLLSPLLCQASPRGEMGRGDFIQRQIRRKSISCQDHGFERRKMSEHKTTV